MKRLMTAVFLRLYALNLGRSFRNSPDVACNDTIMQIGMVLVPPVFTVLLAVVFLSGRENFLRMLHSEPVMIGALLVLGLPLFSWVNRRFSSFGDSPELAKPYMAPRARFATGVGFVLIPVVWLAALVFAINLYVHHGTLT